MKTFSSRGKLLLKNRKRKTGTKKGNKIMIDFCFVVERNETKEKKRRWKIAKQSLKEQRKGLLFQRICAFQKTKNRRYKSTVEVPTWENTSRLLQPLYNKPNLTLLIMSSPALTLPGALFQQSYRAHLTQDTNFVCLFVCLF